METAGAEVVVEQAMVETADTMVLTLLDARGADCPTAVTVVTGEPYSARISLNFNLM
jgi:hypothetical protein